MNKGWLMDGLSVKGWLHWLNCILSMCIHAYSLDYINLNHPKSFKINKRICIIL